VRLIRSIRERGVTILLVEHDMPMVMEVSDRIAVLNYGRLIAQGAPEAIRSDPAVIEAYLGQGSAAREAAMRAAPVSAGPGSAATEASHA
jgi:branched-chain amino acid transport system ATP-binding protein